MSDYFYGQFMPEHLSKMKNGIKLYNSGKYWECHEDLEDFWYEDMGDNARYVYWAVIQVATALYHLADMNMAGADGQIRRAKEKFVYIEEKKVETDILENNLSWSKIKKIVFSIPNDPAVEDFDRLKVFRFKDPSRWISYE